MRGRIKFKAKIGSRSVRGERQEKTFFFCNALFAMCWMAAFLTQKNHIVISSGGKAKRKYFTPSNSLPQTILEM